MPGFSLNNLKPADTIEGLSAPKAAKGGSKQAALRHIDEQIALLDIKKEGKRSFWDTVTNNKRSYTGNGAHVGFSVKVGSSKLMLGGTQEPAVQKGQLEATLRAIKSEIEKGTLDEQFKALDDARGKRVEKMRGTRAANKAKKA